MKTNPVNSQKIELPSAVIFDTDNTLYPYEPAHQAATLAVEKKVESLLGIKKDQFSSAFKTSRNEIKKLLGKTASSHSRLLYIQRTLENLGMKNIYSLKGGIHEWIIKGNEINI